MNRTIGNRFDDQEPQQVTVLGVNSATLVLDNSPDFNQSPVVGLTDIPALTKNLRRLAPSILTFVDSLPNITSKNNQLSFIYNGNPFTAVIPIGLIEYNPENIVKTIVHFMEVAAGVGAGTFVVTPNYAGTMGANFATGTITFPLTGRIVDDSFSRRQRYLWNPEFTAGDVASIQYGPVVGVYTRYFDLHSKAITQDSKISNAFTDDGIVNASVRRFYNSNRVESNIGRLAVIELINLAYFNTRRDRAIGNIDFEWRDEFNEILEVYPTNGDLSLNKNIFSFVMEFKSEI